MDKLRFHLILMLKCFFQEAVNLAHFQICFFSTDTKGTQYLIVVGKIPRVSIAFICQKRIRSPLEIDLLMLRQSSICHNRGGFFQHGTYIRKSIDYLGCEIHYFIPLPKRTNNRKLLFQGIHCNAVQTRFFIHLPDNISQNLIYHPSSFDIQFIQNLLGGPSQLKGQIFRRMYNVSEKFLIDLIIVQGCVQMKHIAKITVSQLTKSEHLS